MALTETLVEAGFTPEEAASLASDGHFVQHNHSKTAKQLRAKISQIVLIYLDEPAVRAAILQTLQASGHDSGAIKEVLETCERAVKAAILKFPPFAEYDHVRVLREGVKAFGAGRADLFKAAVLKFPQFAGLNHARVMRKLKKLGKLVGFSEQEIICNVLKNPALASYSAKRYMACLDVGRELSKEALQRGCELPNDREMVQIVILIQWQLMARE